jgi:hypothetical protein
MAVYRFRQVRLESGLQRTARIVRLHERGERYCGKRALVVPAFPHLADQVQAILLGHPEVTDQDVGWTVFDDVERRPDVAGGRHDRTGGFEEQREDLPGIRLVVDDEDAQAVEALHGSRIGG